ncbi:MAG: sulfite exporter TauE/SafE family protein [Proteobacteria bacterium]|nr:sulfite exporter TauE/SafE family protein [Pseudomonadota bacterium]
MILLISLGLLTGFLGGTLGIGGGVILVPILTLIAGYSWQVACSTSLFCILVTSLLVSEKKLRQSDPHQPSNQQGLIHLDWAKDIEGLGSLFGFFGFLLASWLTPSILLTLLACFLSGLFFYNVQKSYHDFFPQHTKQSHQTHYQHNTWWGLRSLFISFAGLSSGALGIGSGLLLVSVLHLMVKLPINIATATSSYSMASISSGALMGYVLWDHIDWKICAICSIGTLAGSSIGSHLSAQIHQKWLRLALTCVLCTISGMLWKKLLI